MNNSSEELFKRPSKSMDRPQFFLDGRLQGKRIEPAFERHNFGLLLRRTFDFDAVMQQHQVVRTTLDIEPDVLEAAKELASVEGISAGKIISKLARAGLAARGQKKKTRVRNGVPVFESRGVVVTSEQVRRIMEAENI